MVKIKQFLKGVKEGMKLFGENIAVLVNSILLTGVYIIGVGSTAILAKIMGKKFITKKGRGETYWKELNLKKRKKEEYYRQF